MTRALLVFFGLMSGAAFVGCADESGGTTVAVAPTFRDYGTAGGQADAFINKRDAFSSGVQDASSPPDVTPPDAAPEVPDQGGMAPPNIDDEDLCEVLQLPRREFLAEPIGGFAFGFTDIAGDFTATTLNGQFGLRDEWTGCESYVFLTYFPDLRGAPDGPWVGDLLWGSQLQDLVLTGPRNVRYFFVSYEPDPAARQQRMQDQRERFLQTVDAWVDDAGERAFWRRRVHFVTDRVTEIDGSIGRFFSDYMAFLFDPANVVDLGGRGQAQPPLPFAFAIDRFQRWDPVGSLSPVVGQNPTWGMASFAAHFFNHKAGVEDRDQAEDADVFTIMDEDVTARHLIRTVELPPEELMTAYDTAVFDIEVTCPHRNVFACSEWDRIARIEYCLDEACDERREVARWITPYWRRGTRRWMIDASPFLGLFSDGGTQTFKLVMGPNWERGTSRKATFKLRLSTRGTPKSLGLKKVYGGGGFNADYNMNHGPVSFSVPAAADRAELVLILSGHGQSDGDNCSEWCDHRHNFAVNGQAIAEIRSEIPIGALRGCADKAAEGVPPGQFGNWAPGRAFWCPGWPVDAMRFDITDYLIGNNMESLTYSANLAGRPPGGGNIDLSVYVVWYADPEQP